MCACRPELSPMAHIEATGQDRFVAELSVMIETGIATALVDDHRLREAVDRAREMDLQASEQLLRVLSGVLDIREVFPQVSEIAQSVLTHDRLTMTFHD